MKITQGPTLVNPDALNDVPTLRRELSRVNQLLLDYAFFLEQRDAAGSELAGFVNGVLRQHLRGDFRGVAALIEAQLDRSSRLREALEEANDHEDAKRIGQWINDAPTPGASEPLPPYNAGPVDPWSLSSVDDLRQQLDAANRAGRTCAREVGALRTVLDELLDEIKQFVAPHITGDREAAHQALAAFIQKSVVVMDERNKTVH